MASIMRLRTWSQRCGLTRMLPPSFCSSSQSPSWAIGGVITSRQLGAAASGIRVERLEALFLALVAMTIVISLQAVGIVLVVAMLVTPAATAQLLVVRFGSMMAVAVAVGVIGAVAGLYLSYWLDVATGATIVLVQTALFAIALVAGPRTGLLARRRPALA